jgi:hypothetical protein
MPPSTMGPSGGSTQCLETGGGHLLLHLFQFITFHNHRCQEQLFLRVWEVSALQFSPETDYSD